MKIKFAPLGIAFLLLVVSCAENESATEASDIARLNKEYKAEDMPYQMADSTTGNNEQQKGNPPQTQQPVTNADWDRKIIKTGILNVQVDDYKKYYSLLRESVKRTGGYVATEDQNRSEYKLENTVTIKVPVAQFDEAMTLLTTATGKEKVLELKVSSQDVTGEVVDTKSRIEAKRQVRLRYLELLRQANKMEDILKVQHEINAIQEQIEMGAGRVNYLNHASALSTIQLTFYQVLTNSPEPTSTGPSFFTRIWQAFEKGWEFITDIIIGLITVWPLWLAIIAFVLIIKKYKPLTPRNPPNPQP